MKPLQSRRSLLGGESTNRQCPRASHRRVRGIELDGAAELLFRPSEILLFRVDPTEVVAAHSRLATPIDGKLERVYSSVWGHRPERRMFVFIFDRPDKNRPLDIRMFFDLPAIKSPALTADLKKAQE